MWQITVGVLAGGRNVPARLNRAMHQMNNLRFMKRLTRELSGFSETLISASFGQWSKEYEKLGFPVLYDEYQDIGPIEGLRQVLTHAGNPYVFVCAVDMPFITRELVEYMAGFLSEEYDCYVAADEKHLQPLCAIYAKSALPVVEELIAEGNYRLSEIFRRMRTRYIRLSAAGMERRLTRNVNLRGKPEKRRLPVFTFDFELKEIGKRFLIVRMINGFIV